MRRWRSPNNISRFMSGLLAELPHSEKEGWPWSEATDPRLYSSPSGWPRVTIITPSFNQGDFIEETIRSVLLQNYPNLQYIVIDGGSTDGTVEILEKYSPWIDYWVSEPDRGQSHAINKGLEKADGDWFNWINSDDILWPGSLHALAMAARNHRDAKLITGRLQPMGTKGDEAEAWGIKLTGDLEDDMVNHRMAQPAMFYRRSVVDRVPDDLHYAMDYALWVQTLAERGEASIMQLPEVLAGFRFHENSKTHIGRGHFEREERKVLATVLRAQGCAEAFICMVDSGEPLSQTVLCPQVSLSRLKSVIARRYLLGEWEEGWCGEHRLHTPLLKQCFQTIPGPTISRVIRSSFRKVVRS
jgi:hypothetical protein